ncbi:T9SS type A sorting domain-containing protein [candidate division WOR-3 bacterium]|uniref:T9SS type A sorting domain-containing protein n=1 Tax=candidate division WOR-3 bacterium TaxID=2052148 RepID=A0A9D5QDL1_UNCW3|nr:T9SS type A sorting domain-containing protein [candidate division WOR-3 bacterium]MBD3365202.1 T9SS type A sorting domain-containing protein [candidate division WOR-3 bacterium]
MKSLIEFLVLSCSTAFAISFEFPISTASDDQYAPSICWDGDKFWVVWIDRRAEDNAIYGTWVDEEGNVGYPEGKLLHSTPNAMSKYDYINSPSMAFGRDTFCLMWTEEPLAWQGEVWVNLLDTLLNPLYEEPLFLGQGYEGEVLFCKEHFALPYVEWYETEIEVWSFPSIAYLDAPNREFTSWSLAFSWPGGCFPTCFWNAEDELLEILYTPDFYEIKFLAMPDTLDPFYEIGPHSWIITASMFPEEVSIYPIDAVMFGDKYALVGGTNHGTEWSGGVWFDLFEYPYKPLLEEPFILREQGLRYLRYCSMAFGCNKLITTWGLWFGPYMKTPRLMGAELDTLGNVISSGDLFGGPGYEWAPDIKFGSNHFLLVWTDNRNGNWDIYGRILDDLPYAGIAEDGTPPEVPASITVYPSPSSGSVDINLSNIKGGERQIIIVDALGRKVWKDVVTANTLNYIWNGEAQPSGVYYVLVSAKDSRATAKFIISK